MKKVLFIFLGAVMLITLTGCFNKSAQQTATPEATGQQNQNGAAADNVKDETESFSGSLNDLLLRNKPVKCDYSYSENGNKIDGSAYISDKKSYTEFAMTMPDNQTFDTQSINDGVWLYTWSKKQNFGSKMKLSSLEAIDKNMQKSPEGDQTVQSVDYDKKINYTCRLWIPDANKFIPPSDIQFQDLTQMMEATQDLLEGLDTNSTPTLKDMCGKCDLLSGDAKDQCQKAYGC